VYKTPFSVAEGKFISNIPRKSLLRLNPRRARTVHHNKIAGREKCRVILPRVYLPERISADNEKYFLLTAGKPMKVAYGINGIGFSGTLQFNI